MDLYPSGHTLEGDQTIELTMYIIANGNLTSGARSWLNEHGYTKTIYLRFFSNLSGVKNEWNNYILASMNRQWHNE